MRKHLERAGINPAPNALEAAALTTRLALGAAAIKIDALWQDPNQPRLRSLPVLEQHNSSKPVL